MTSPFFSPRALVLFGILALGAFANPINVDARNPAVDKCATVRCGNETKCVVVSGTARCVPITAQVCGKTVCAQGLVCCNASCSICTKPDMMCTQQACNPSAVEPLPPIVDHDRVCGTKICPVGQECCNASCGTCVAPGKGCTKQLCLPPKEIKCGKAICPAGTVCCNSSCGICTPPDGVCTQQFCMDD
ncbi:hypothetical protein QBC42DRAFT_25769 [Cladorrhinum samala]|uniref:Uncharacterized protein n=1 Tax=Cladorrhinum samala TaxID=585594 RepID=A0AAV9HZA1_9PEZI|nr:hypothetical protein QBC42DRAFT_25769 [Cladorrhinum samala]